jgi:hypothetical protein
VTFVLVERTFAQPATLDEIERVHGHIGWCLDKWGARPLLHGLAATRLRSLCLYEAPDVEAIRQVSRQMAVEPEIWPASVRGPWQAGGPVPALGPGEHAFALLDHRLDRPSADEDLDEQGAPADSCALIHRVRFLASFLSHDRTRIVDLCAAPDVAAVRAFDRTAEHPASEIWAAQAHRAGA